MEHREYKSINKSVRKKDSIHLLLGKPVYTDDVTPKDALVIKILRSPYANAIVETINTAAAKKVPGVVDIYTWEDVPGTRFTIAGQTFPEPSPYDRLIIDRHLRFAGDVVAIIAAETEKSALKAAKLIKVKYNVLEAVLDFAPPKTIPFSSTPKTTGFRPAKSEEIQNEILSPPTRISTVMLMRFWQTAISCSTERSTPRHSTKP